MAKYSSSQYQNTSFMTLPHRKRRGGNCGGALRTTLFLPAHFKQDAQKGRRILRGGHTLQ